VHDIFTSADVSHNFYQQVSVVAEIKLWHNVLLWLVSELQLDDTFSCWCRLLYLHVWSVLSSY